MRDCLFPRESGLQLSKVLQPNISEWIWTLADALLLVPKWLSWGKLTESCKIKKSAVTNSNKLIKHTHAWAFGGFHMDSVVENLPIMQEAWRRGFSPWVGNIPCRKKWQSAPVFLPGKIPWTEETGRLVHRVAKVLDRTEWLNNKREMEILPFFLRYQQFLHTLYEPRTCFCCLVPLPK